MPELPELQAHAERLHDTYAGHVLSGFRALSFTALKTAGPDPAVTVGHPLEGVDRRGKFLRMRFAPATFVVHLMQGGRLEPDPKEAARPRGGLARWSFEDAPPLLLTEPGTERRAGVWVVTGDPEAAEPLVGLGPDAGALGRDELAAVARAHSTRLHGLLRDQRVVAGIGRRLANEICHRARLSPFANASHLDDDELDRLHEAIGACLGDALTAERARSTMSSSKERPGAVHHRTGEPCPVCGDVVRAVEYRAYTVQYCAGCQTGGRVLADNTTSRFLR